jgi:hypothetical protein
VNRNGSMAAASHSDACLQLSPLPPTSGPVLEDLTLGGCRDIFAPSLYIAHMQGLQHHTVLDISIEQNVCHTRLGTNPCLPCSTFGAGITQLAAVDHAAGDVHKRETAKEGFSDMIAPDTVDGMNEM